MAGALTDAMDALWLALRQVARDARDLAASASDESPYGFGVMVSLDRLHDLNASLDALAAAEAHDKAVLAALRSMG